jgi:hypothetical protein
MPTIQRESTEYVYLGVQGSIPSSAELAFLDAGTRPTSGDWHSSTLVTSSGDPLWADAQASGATGDYFVALLIGAFGGIGIILTAGDYQVWLRLTGAVEQPVRIAPATLEIA